MAACASSGRALHTNRNYTLFNCAAPSDLTLGKSSSCHMAARASDHGRALRTITINNLLIGAVLSGVACGMSNRSIRGPYLEKVYDI